MRTAVVALLLSLALAARAEERQPEGAGAVDRTRSAPRTVGACQKKPAPVKRIAQTHKMSSGHMQGCDTGRRDVFTSIDNNSGRRDLSTMEVK